MSFIFSILYLGGWTLPNLIFFENILFILNFSWLINYKILLISLKFNFFFWFKNFFGIKGLNFLYFLLTYVFESSILVIKSFLISSLFIVIRASLPRYKFSQLVSLGWEVFIPVNLFFIVFLLLVL
jgi:NADH-quinone oxidoreductase subunit H